MITAYRGYTLVARFGVTADQRHISIYSGIQRIDEAPTTDAAKAIIDAWLDAK